MCWFPLFTLWELTKQLISVLHFNQPLFVVKSDFDSAETFYRSKTVKMFSHFYCFKSASPSLNNNDVAEVQILFLMRRVRLGEVNQKSLF